MLTERSKAMPTGYHLCLRHRREAVVWGSVGLGNCLLIIKVASLSWGQTVVEYRLDFPFITFTIRPYLFYFPVRLSAIHIQFRSIYRFTLANVGGPVRTYQIS